MKTQNPVMFPSGSPRALAALAAVFSIALAGCMNPLDAFLDGRNRPEQSAATGSLIVSLNGISASERTVMPYSFADIASYTLKAECAGETTIEQTVSLPSEFSLPSLKPGSWTITVNALDEDDTLLYSGSATASVTAGSTSEAAVQMHTAQTAGGTGSFSVTFEFPDPKIPLANVVFELYEHPLGAENKIASCTVTPSTGIITVSGESLKSGTYELSLSVTIGGEELELPGGEIIRIYDNLLSTTPASAPVVCDSESLTNTLNVYYVDASGGGTGKRPNSPITFSEALTRIQENTVLSENGKGTIVLMATINLTNGYPGLGEMGFAPFTKPVAIRSLNPLAPESIQLLFSGVSRIFTVGSPTEAGSLELTDVSVKTDNTNFAGETLVRVDKGTLTLKHNGQLAFNTGSSGGAVRLTGPDSAFRLDGGAIYQCSSMQGGAILAEKGTVTIAAGNIQNCSATGFGAAIYAAAGATVTAEETSSGVIKADNTATRAGRIAVESIASIPAAAGDLARLRATCEIPGTIYMPTMDIVLVAPQATNAQIPVALAAAETIPVYLEIGSMAMGTPTVLQTPVVVNNMVVVSGMGGKLCGSPVDQYGVPLENPATGALLSGPLFTINTGGTLRLEMVHLKGTGENYANQYPVVQINGGELELTNSSSIMNHNNTSLSGTGYGGAINMASGSAVLTGSSYINGCKAERGGAVFMADGSFMLTGTAYIEYCSAKYQGGALWIGGGSAILDSTSATAMSSFMPVDQTDPGRIRYGGIIFQEGGTVTNSASIRYHDESSSNLHGVGVYQASGTYTMSDGSISNCKSMDGKGGGLYIAGTFIMTGGDIGFENSSFGNSALRGGGLYIAPGGQASLQGGMIRGNTATESGGGVCIAGGTVNIAGTDIFGNIASFSGAGVWMDAGEPANARLTFDNGLSRKPSIHDNSVSTPYGGGVWNVTPLIPDSIIISGTVATNAMLTEYVSGNTASDVPPDHFPDFYTRDASITETIINSSVPVCRNTSASLAGVIQYQDGTNPMLEVVRRKYDNTTVNLEPVLTDVKAGQKTWTCEDEATLPEDGIYTYEIKLSIDNTLIFTLKRQVEYDTAGPTVFAVTPPASEGRFRVVSVTASDGSSGVKKVEYSLDGSAWTDCFIDGDWYVDYPWGNGAYYTFKFRATDMLDNLGPELTLSNCVADTVGPGIGTATPDKTIYTTGETAYITVYGIADDAGIASLRIEGLGSSQDLDPVYLDGESAQFSLNLNTPGTYDTVKFTFTDGVGNEAVHTVSIGSVTVS